MAQCLECFGFGISVGLTTQPNYSPATYVQGCCSLLCIEGPHKLQSAFDYLHTVYLYVMYMYNMCMIVYACMYALRPRSTLGRASKALRWRNWCRLRWSRRSMEQGSGFRV